jgi:hypothetical protein
MTLELYAPLFDHAVAVNARSLIVFMVLSFVGALAIVFPGGRRPPVTHALSILLLIACALYLFVATGTVYGATGAGRSIKVLVLTTAVAAIVLGYRFVLLMITLYST